jgi:uncharacterized protein YbcV (DUF1398 family)
MNPSTVAVLHECSRRSQEGTITFPEVVGKLIGAHVESYHADLYRREKTYYLPSGESHIEPLEIPSPTVAEGFSADGVEQSIRAIQRGEINYMEFLRRIIAAGCASYFVCITGRRAIYFGRTGDHYVEPFPAAE